MNGIQALSFLRPLGARQQDKPEQTEVPFARIFATAAGSLFAVKPLEAEKKRKQPDCQLFCSSYDEMA